jgi:type II secretory pathway component PulM
MDLAQKLKDRWASLSERDQRALKLGAPWVLGILIVALFVTVFTESQAAAERVETKRAWLADLPAARDRTQRLQRLGTDTGLPLGALVERVTARYGIKSTLEPQSNSSIRLRAESVPFDAVIETLADLEAASVSIRRATLNSTQAGRVDLDLELQKSVP